MGHLLKTNAEKEDLEAMHCGENRLYINRFFATQLYSTSFILQVTKFKKYKSWNPKARQLFWADLWLAAELLRELIRGQLKSITDKEPGFGDLSICTS